MFCSRRWVAKLCRSVCGDTPLVDPSDVGSRMAGAIELARGERIDPVLPGKQPPLWPACLAPSAQQLEQMRRQHHVSVFAALSLLDPDHHALAVDVGYLQGHYLGHAQSRPVGHTQSRLVLEPWRSIEEARHLVWTEDDRQLPSLVDECRVLDDGISLERDPEEEPQRRHGRIACSRADAALGHMQLKAADVLEARLVRRPAKESCQVLDRADVALLGLRR